MTEQKPPAEINLPQLLDLCGGLLQRLFFQAPEKTGKALFKEIKQGKKPDLGKITVQDSLELSLKLALDYSEYVGPGFNFNVFKAGLGGALQRIAGHLKEKKELNVLTSEQGGMLIHLPGLIEREGQLNVLLLTFEPIVAGQLTLNIIFVDPSQYESKDD